jgi:hypothetical protein
MISLKHNKVFNKFLYSFRISADIASYTSVIYERARSKVDITSAVCTIMTPELRLEDLVLMSTEKTVKTDAIVVDRFATNYLLFQRYY